MELPEIVRHPSLLFRRYRIPGEARMLVKRALAQISEVVWRVPLDRDRTVRLLHPYELGHSSDPTIVLPERIPAAGERSPDLGEYAISFEPEYVWKIERDERIRSIRITASGSILLNERLLLDTDFGSLPGVTDIRSRRSHAEAEIAIVPWSHKWATYYEFVFHVLAKLCRIKEAIDSTWWRTATICYPLRFGFERQYTSLLGLQESAFSDPRAGVELVARSIVISNLQGKSRLPSPTSIAALRRAFLDEGGGSRDGQGIYLTREGGWERQVRNEAEVRDVVSSRGFRIVDPARLGVTEQIRTFSSAPVVVSPHGSALTNLVWCSPGTRVVELFSRSFTPPMFAYMSQVLDLPYTCLVDHASESHHWTNMHKDMIVDTHSLARLLEAT